MLESETTDANDPEACPACSDCVLLWVLFAVGLVPLIGWCIRGQWDQGEVGMGLVLVVFSGLWLARGYAADWRARGYRLQS